MQPPTQSIRDTLTPFLADAPVLRAAGLTGGAALGLLWESATGALAYVLVSAFLADLGLGVLKALARGGLNAFEWPKFWGAWIKFGAAMMGVWLCSSVDLLAASMRGEPPTSAPITAGGMVALSIAFLVSAAGNLNHFFPPLGAWIQSALHRLQPATDPHPLRRSTDPDGSGPGGSGGPGRGGLPTVTESDVRAQWAERLSEPRKGESNGHAKLESA